MTTTVTAGAVTEFKQWRATRLYACLEILERECPAVDKLLGEMIAKPVTDKTTAMDAWTCGLARIYTIAEAGNTLSLLLSERVGHEESQLTQLLASFAQRLSMSVPLPDSHFMMRKSNEEDAYAFTTAMDTYVTTRLRLSLVSMQSYAAGMYQFIMVNHDAITAAIKAVDTQRVSHLHS